MKAELRADGYLHVSGYVNVPGRQSRPVLTPRGRVVEVIEQGAFARALSRAGSLRMLLDHDERRALASTGDGNLKAHEDAVGLYAESVITDPEVIAGAKAGKLRGWSFDMRHVDDDVETRADGLPIRHVKDFDISEISLIMNKMPAYSSTSIEVRADTGDDEEYEIRATDLDAEFIDRDTEDPEEQPAEEPTEEPEEPEGEPEAPEEQPAEEPEDGPEALAEDLADLAEKLRTYEARLRALEL